MGGAGADKDRVPAGRADLTRAGNPSGEHAAPPQLGDEDGAGRRAGAEAAGLALHASRSTVTAWWSDAPVASTARAARMRSASRGEHST